MSDFIENITRGCVWKHGVQKQVKVIKRIDNDDDTYKSIQMKMFCCMIMQSDAVSKHWFYFRKHRGIGWET